MDSPKSAYEPTDCEMAAADMYSNLEDDELMFNAIERLFVSFVHPLDVLYVIHSYNNEILTCREVERVRTATNNKGAIEGARELLISLRQYPGWFPSLMEVLRDPEVKRAHVADNMEKKVEEEAKRRRFQAFQASSKSLPDLVTSGGGHYREDLEFHELTLKEYDVLLVGKTGCGKSATGNSVLRKVAFESKKCMKSVTSEVQIDFSQYAGLKLKVVDVPGVGDTNYDPQAGVELAVKYMSQAIAMSPRGYHVILLVVSMAQRFTNEDLETIAILKNIFGSHFIKDHAILLLTHGEDFAEEDSDNDLIGWCKSQGGPFAELVEDCQERVVLFENKTRNRETKRQQLERLFVMIDGLSKDGKRHTNEIFQKAQGIRTQMLQNPRLAIVSEDLLREFENASEQLNHVNFYNFEYSLNQLTDLSRRVDSWGRIMEEQCGHTRARGVVEEFQTFVKTQIDNNQIYIQGLARSGTGMFQSQNPGGNTVEQGLKEAAALGTQKYKNIVKEQSVGYLAQIAQNIVVTICDVDGPGKKDKKTQMTLPWK